MDDWKVEIIAASICRHLGIYHIPQRVCRINLYGRSYMGVESDNLMSHGLKTISFESILENVGESSNDDWYIKANSTDKIYRMADKVSNASGILYRNGISKPELVTYMVNCAFVDILVYNNDRHTRNYNIIQDRNGYVGIAPIHDCGMTRLSY